MTFTCKLIYGFLFITLLNFSSNVWSQNRDTEKLSDQFKELLYERKYDRVLALTKKHLQSLKVTNGQDSIFWVKLRFFEHNALQHTQENFDLYASLKNLIRSCPKSESGDSLKAVLYNKKAYFESESISTMASFKSISNSIELLENISKPNVGYLMGAYLLQSSNHAYFGNFKQARQSMRLAEDLYAKNKQLIDQNTQELNGNNHRLGVIAKYRKTYMLWKLSTDSKDSLTLVQTMDALEKMHSQPEFHKDERVYYSTALNHVGDWLVSHKPDSLTSEKDVSTGLSYLLKSLYYIEKKGYPGTPWSLRYNIAKAYSRGDQLEKADSVMNGLFQGISSTDGRLPFFYAQKALIKAKKKEKDSALAYFHKSIEKIHQGDSLLKTDYSNFQPSKRYNQTRLLLRIHEELEKYYSSDSLISKKISRLPYMALQQFENSYLDVNFNSQQNKELRQIIRGILKANRMGSLENQLPQKSILSKFEIFKNQLSWKKFYENRYTNSLPALDSIKQRQVELASLLNKAKIDQNIAAEDSISNLIQQHQRYKKEIFPQWELLSDFKFSVQTLQNQLEPNELVLKYILLDNEIAIYKISKTNMTTETFDWTDENQQLIINFIESSRDRNYNQELASQLSKLLLPKIDESITRLVINPDGILFKLPFEILRTNGNLLAEDYSIRYTSNLGFIHYSPDGTTPTDNVHIYAPKYTSSATNSNVRDEASLLQGASQEAKTISRLFPSTLFNDETLNKSTFVETSDKAKVLHLAMHAEVNSDYSEFSRLLFSNNLDKDEDHLYLEELYGLSLSADLAILSACNTGMGLEKNGNLESFQRAFTFAGVPATVASLWEVPDASTKQIMVLFYENLKKGQSKSEALRNAKLTYRDNYIGTKLSAPYFWAGFVVYGSDTPVAKKSYSYLIYLTGILIAFTVIIGYNRRKLLRIH